jgi:hypothetical protein
MLHSPTRPLPDSAPQAQNTKQARRTLMANEPLPAIPTLLEQIIAARKASRAAAWADEDEGHYDDHDVWLEDD